MASNMLTVSEDLNSAEAGTTSPTATSPVRPDIRRSLSPILDFGSRRNFCNISECSYCRPLAENHRPSPLRSPVAPPTASTKLISLHFSSCDAFVIFCLFVVGWFPPVAIPSVIVCGGSDRSQHRPRRWPASPTTAATCAAQPQAAQGKKKRKRGTSR